MKIKLHRALGFSLLIDAYCMDNFAVGKYLKSINENLHDITYGAF